MVSGITTKEEGSSGTISFTIYLKNKSSTSAATCSSIIDSMNESETVQKAYADELQQDAEDAKIEKLEENMLSEDL